jgi:MnmE helical domain
MSEWLCPPGACAPLRRDCRRRRFAAADATKDRGGKEPEYGLEVRRALGGAYLARERHLVAPRAAQERLALAAEHAQAGNQALDLYAKELRLAQEEFNSITEEFTSNDLLGVAFSRFCIGNPTSVGGPAKRIHRTGP